MAIYHQLKKKLIAFNYMCTYTFGAEKKSRGYDMSVRGYPIDAHMRFMLHVINLVHECERLTDE